jgi:hypothetical protein
MLTKMQQEWQHCYTDKKGEDITSLSVIYQMALIMKKI